MSDIVKRVLKKEFRSAFGEGLTREGKKRGKGKGSKKKKKVGKKKNAKKKIKKFRLGCFPSESKLGVVSFVWLRAQSQVKRLCGLLSAPLKIW